MQNQRLPKIDMAKSGNKRSRFNFSHDVNTTADFGVCQPAMCKLIVPGSKTTLNTESLTRLAPMVAPTFGRLKYKIWHQFVEIDDICEQFKAFLAQEPIYSAVDSVTAIPTQVPSIPLSCLTSLCFVGARATIYKVKAGSGVYDAEYEAFRSNVSADMTELSSLFSWNENVSGSNMRGCPITYDNVDSFSGNTSNHVVLQLAPWKDSSGAGRNGIANWNPTDPNASSPCWLVAPLQNAYSSSAPNFVDLGWNIDSNGDILNHPIMPESADYLYEFDVKESGVVHTYVIAFKFSDVGKRFRKNLIGLGYQLDLEASGEVSFLPLLAYYKAYWNLFGLTQWQDWQQTNAYQLIHLLNSYYNIHLGTITDSTLASNASAHLHHVFIGFIKDVMDCFVTDSADYVSSHLPNTAVSPTVAPTFWDVDNGTPHIYPYDSAGTINGTPDLTPNGHSYITGIIHGHADEEFLKRLYKWTNRNTIIGRRIAELLRSQGLGKFVDECKSDFIGYTEDVITISDVVSTADTAFQAGSGATLGEFGGKGVQYTKGKNFSFENDVFGYWVTICAIVPESGFSQQIDPTLYALDKNGFYQPEFDSLGYDASRKSVVQGASDFRHKSPLNSLAATFGYKPRYFEYKFAQNITNGDMSLRGTRDTYLPYFLDKFIVVNDKYIAPKSSNPAQFNVRDLFDASQLPTADERVWRYITKFPWLGNLRRIFAAGGNVDDNMRHRMTDLDFMYWVSSNHDDFLIHNIFDMQCYAPMLAVEDSYETTDDDERSDMSVGKA